MIRTLIVDDQKLICQGLKALLELDPDIKIVGSANNGQSAIELVEALKPDIVLIDIRMPGMDGVTATRIICKRFPDTKILVLSSYDDEMFLADALCAGARGYLLKDTPAEELVKVIRAVDKGYSQIGPGLLEKITHKIAESSSVDRTRALKPESAEGQTDNGFSGKSVLKKENEHHNSTDSSVQIDQLNKVPLSRPANFLTLSDRCDVLQPSLESADLNNRPINQGIIKTSASRGKGSNKNICTESNCSQTQSSRIQAPAFKYEDTPSIPTDLLLESNSVSTQLPAFKFLEVQVEPQLNKFEPNALQEVVRLATEQGAIAQLLAYINQLLKDDLNNLAALYLTGMLWATFSQDKSGHPLTTQIICDANDGHHKGCPDLSRDFAGATREQEKQPIALHYLKLGFQAGLKQGLCREDLLWFYRAGVSLEATEAFNWLTQVNAPWNNEEGLSFLVQEADRLFSKASTHYRTLLALRQIRAMLALTDSVKFPIRFRVK